MGRCPECGRATVVERQFKDQPLDSAANSWVTGGWVCTADGCLLGNPEYWGLSDEPAPL